MIIYDYYAEPLINEIDWHCGCTWYSKHGMDGSPRIIQIGCDYQHYWDEGHMYNLDTVKYDVKNTIIKFLDHVPGYKYWCCGNGKLYDLKDGIVKGNRFFSREYYGDTMEEFKTEVKTQ